MTMKRHLLRDLVSITNSLAMSSEEFFWAFISWAFNCSLKFRGWFFTAFETGGLARRGLSLRSRLRLLCDGLLRSVLAGLWRRSRLRRRSRLWCLLRRAGDLDLLDLRCEERPPRPFDDSSRDRWCRSRLRLLERECDRRRRRSPRSVPRMISILQQN